jgi:hypothetical protein
VPRRGIESEPNGETLAHGMVLNLLEGLHDVGHVVVMDNYFTSIGFFKELLSRGFSATGTIRSNRVGLSEALKKTKEFNKMKQGSLDWHMHNPRGILCVLWKDK